MRAREIQSAIRRQHKLPKRCECGGLLDYTVSFGRVWSVCLRCTPVVKVDLAKLKLTTDRETP